MSSRCAYAKKNSSSLALFDADHNWDERILSEMFRY